MKNWILCAGAFLLVVLCTSAFAGDKKLVVCYFASWATHRPGGGKFEVEDINPFLCTHVIFAFTGIASNGTVRILDYGDHITNGSIRRFNELKQQNPDLKTLVSIGGWNEGSVNFSRVANNVTLRSRFVNDVVAFVLYHKFDGLDVAWNYPGQCGGNATTDRFAYVELLAELRAHFDKHKLLLTAAVAAAESSASISYNIPAISKYLDFINLMTFDLHGIWDYETGHNAPLYPNSTTDVTRYERSLNVDACVDYWLSNGAPKEKLMVGMATYGRTFNIGYAKCVVGTPVKEPGSPGPYTREPGILGYNEICLQLKEWEHHWDYESLVPYACRKNEFLSYDNITSIMIKAKYVVERDLGGAMVWSIDTDDFRGDCHGYKFPLIMAINEVFGTGP